MLREAATSGAIPARCAAMKHSAVSASIPLIITPRIISDTLQAREATDELRRKLPSLEGWLPLPMPKPTSAAEPVGKP